MGKPGDPYRPSNGTEGECFMGAHCHQCLHERWMHRQKEDRDQDKCAILSATMGYDVSDSEYPKEWTYTAEGKPTCTKWVKFDCGTGDDPNEPPPTEPEDPRQLMMPFDITELFPCEEVTVFRTGIVETRWLKELEHAH